MGFSYPTGITILDVKSVPGSASAVPASSRTLVGSYTVPTGKSAVLHRIEFSGNNIGTYEYSLNSTTEGVRHTWFNGPMFGTFEFTGGGSEGIKLVAADKVEIYVTHERPDVGDFYVRIQVLELDC